MTKLHHINCVKIVSSINDNVCGHCLVIQENDKIILVDTGVGLLDTQNPTERIGQQLIDMVGYHFNENQTAIRQIENLGLNPKDVTDCVITHLDNDHIGGLADFPNATIHLGAEELENYNLGKERYLKIPLAHNPHIKTYAETNTTWFGFEARRLDIETEIYLIPLFGHTLGHCGVAININNKWLFYVGDAYYMRVELTIEDHPVTQLAKLRAEDEQLRIASLDKIRRFAQEHPEIEMFGYHDIEEFKFFQNKAYGS